MAVAPLPAMHLKSSLAGAKRILVCLRWGIGDVVMELPLLQALRRQAPRAHISALGASPAVELLEHETSVDRVVEVQRLGFAHWGDPGSERCRAGIRDWCCDEGFDCIVEASHAPLGVRLALGGLDVPGCDTGDHRFDGNVQANGLALLARAASECWGFEIDPSAPRLVLTPEERSWAAKRREELAGSAPLAALAPVASSALKRAAPAEFARTGDALAARHGCRLLVFGGPGNPDTGAVLHESRYPDRIHVVEPLHLRATAALLEQCRVLICNDTGLMHLGAAVGATVVAVFACTSPSLYLPPGGVAVSRWRSPCRHLEAPLGRFGVTPCVAAGRCLVPDHERYECWADAAMVAASAALVDEVSCSAGPR